MRALSLALTAALFACSSGDPGSTELTSATKGYDISDIPISVTAGVTGSIWVLETYQGGGKHPGLNAIDIGAAGGSSVWHQLEGVPKEVGGGWIFVDFLQEAGLCSQFNPGDANYNGAKLRVYTLFYGQNGDYLGHHSSVYQHVEPAEGVKDAWFKWNNAASGVMWEAPDVVLGNQAQGGLYVGNLFDSGGKTILNNNGKLCHSGNHLHQEGYDSRADLAISDKVSGRVDAAHVFLVKPEAAAIGNPPFAPPSVGGPPPNNPPNDPPPNDPPNDPPPATTCACQSGVDNFCHYAANTPNCPMTAPGGYCDPNGDGGYDDADWVTGWYDFKDKCSGGVSDPPPPPPEDPPPPAPACACNPSVDNFCHYAPNTPDCPMTAAGGYCDPNGDGSYADANWETGWYDYHDKCGG